MSTSRRPERSSTRRVAGMFAVSISCGPSPPTTKSTGRAPAETPSSRARSAGMIKTGAAPSVICDALPAVTRPPTDRNAEARCAQSSIDVARTPPSTVIAAPSPPDTAMSSPSRRPSRMAAIVRCWLRDPHASISSQGMSQRSAIISVDSPCETSPPRSEYRALTDGPNGNPYRPSAVDDDGVAQRGSCPHVFLASA